jgi:hypothetical protein
MTCSWRIDKITQRLESGTTPLRNFHDQAAELLSTGVNVYPSCFIALDLVLYDGVNDDGEFVRSSSGCCGWFEFCLHAAQIDS